MIYIFVTKIIWIKYFEFGSVRRDNRNIFLYNFFFPNYGREVGTIPSSTTFLLDLFILIMLFFYLRFETLIWVCLLYCLYIYIVFALIWHFLCSFLWTKSGKYLSRIFVLLKYNLNYIKKYCRLNALKKIRQNQALGHFKHIQSPPENF